MYEICKFKLLIHKRLSHANLEFIYAKLSFNLLEKSCALSMHNKYNNTVCEFVYRCKLSKL